MTEGQRKTIQDMENITDILLIRYSLPSPSHPLIIALQRMFPNQAYGGGGFNPLRDPVRNVALHTQILNTEYNRDKAVISDNNL